MNVTIINKERDRDLKESKEREGRHTKGLFYIGISNAITTRNLFFGNILSPIHTCERDKAMSVFNIC